MVKTHGGLVHGATKRISMLTKVSIWGDGGRILFLPPYEPVYDSQHIKILVKMYLALSLYVFSCIKVLETMGFGFLHVGMGFSHLLDL